MVETDIQRGGMRALRSLGFWVVRFGVSRKRGKGGTHSGETGMPDTCVMGYGWIEYKADADAELSPAQLAWHEKAAKFGIRVAVVWSISQAVQVALSWRRDGRPS